MRHGSTEKKKEKRKWMVKYKVALEVWYNQ